MKKILFQKRNSALLSPAGLSLGVSLVGVVFLLVMFRLIFPGAFIFVSAPLFRVGGFLTSGVTDIRASFADAVRIARERDTLRSELGALTNKNLALEAKIADLTALLGKDESEVLGIVAGVLARPPQSPYDSLIVAAGSTSGVSVDMRAFASGGVPIGTVESVTASSARIALFSSGGRTLTAWVGHERVPITLTGAGGGTFVAMAPKASGILVGDIVYSVGGGALPMGSVAEIQDNPSSPSVVILLKPLINLFEVTWVILVP